MKEKGTDKCIKLLIIITSIFLFFGAIISLFLVYSSKYGLISLKNIMQGNLNDKNVIMAYGYIFLVLFIYFLTFLIQGLPKNNCKIIYILMLIGFTFVIRYIPVIFLKNQPISDFLRVYNFASLTPMDKYSDIYIDFYENAIYSPYYAIESMTLRGILQCIGCTVVNAQMVNIFMSCIVSIVIYQIGCLIYNNSYQAMNCALVYVFLPSAIFQDNFLAHENYNIFFSAFFLLCILHVLKSRTIRRKSIAIVFAGIFLGLLDLYKPVKIVYFLGLVMSIMWNCEFRKNIRKTVFTLGIIFFISSITTSIGITILEQYIGTKTYTLASKSMLIGLDLSSENGKGQWSQDKVELFEEFVNTSNSKSEINKKVFQYLGENWRENSGKIIPLFIDKFITEWGNEDAYIHWATQSTSESVKLFVRKFTLGIIWTVGIYTSMIYLWGIVACFTVIEKQNIFLIYNLSVVLIFSMMLLLTEAQARYKSILFVPLCIICGSGINEFSTWIHTQVKSRRSRL